MGRAYPRFLLSKSTQSKSKGTFIIHTLDPAFIAEPTFNEVRQIIDLHIIKVWQEGSFFYNQAAEIAEKEIPKWWRYSGIHDSDDPRDRVIAKLSKLPFLRDVVNEFSVEEAQEIIRIIFPKKMKTFYGGVTSYGIKHDLERISELFNSSFGVTKYCNNETIKKALINEGFKTKPDSANSPNIIANISEHDVNLIREIVFYRTNNFNRTEAF